jgi:DNA repair exonuclease SbcCD nuclease subunit
MKFLFTADIHLSRYGQDKVEETSNLPERLHSIKTALYNMAGYCIENEINTFIIGGDIMHSKSIIYSIAQELMLKFFYDFPDLVFWIIDGNHDLSGKGVGAISSLNALRTVSNVQWITGPASGDPSQLFVPYSHDVVNQVKSGKSQILISHFGLNEGVLNSGISIISDLSLNDLAGKYELVLLGHYHKPQEIIKGNIKLYYVGSPVQLDWGEKGDEKRFLIVDTNTLDVQSIPTTGYRKHIELGLTADNKDEVFKLAHEAKEAGNHVKIIQKESVNLDDIKDDFLIIDKREVDITNRGITSSMSEEDKMKKFMEIKEIPQANHELYLKHGVEIIENCEGE